jgi:hypothetical protein
MHIRTRTGVFAASVLATAALVAGGGALAGPASAAPLSSTNCAFSNGCATLNGTDAAGNAVSMDAKYQNPKEIVIGYPDKAGDGATSFDAVIHYTNAKGGYADTGFTLSPTFTSIPCDLTTDPTTTPTLAAGALTDGGHVLTVNSTTGTVTASPSSGTSLTVGGGITGGTLTVDEQYASDGTSCQASYTATIPAGSTPTAAFTGPDTASLTIPTSPGGSTWTFLDFDSGGTFTFTGLPAGVSVSGGSLTADTSTAIPGTYTNVGVSYKAPDGAVFTATFTLKISGGKVVLTDVPYYTFVYAKNGVWSSQCVTDDNGSGGLNLQACTLGKNQYQDWFALNSAGIPQNDLQTNVTAKYWIQNVLAAITDKASSCMIDNSTLNPGTPESDAVDAAAGGRELRATGSCTAAGDTWGWRT